MRTSLMRLPGSRDGRDPIDTLIRTVRQAHEWGFDRYWVPQLPGLMDVLVALPIVSREVPGVELGTAVLPIPTRHPMTMAQEALTANLAMSGRLLLGLGTSSPRIVEDVWGMTFTKAAQQMTEYLDVLLPALTEGVVSATGEFYSAHGSVRVGAAPPPPVYIAALGTRMLAIAGSRTRGTCTWMTGPQTLRDHVIPALAEAASPGHGRAEVIALYPVWVTDDVAAARRHLSQSLAVYGEIPFYRAMLDREGVQGPADNAVVGSVDDIHRHMSQLAAIGVDEFSCVLSSPDEADRARTAEAVRAWRA